MRSKVLKVFIKSLKNATERRKNVSGLRRASKHGMLVAMRCNMIFLGGPEKGRFYLRGAIRAVCVQSGRCLH